MLQIVKNSVKKGEEESYITVAKEFVRELNSLEDVRLSQIFRDEEFIFIITEWLNYDSEDEFKIFNKYKSDLKPYFISNESYYVNKV